MQDFLLNQYLWIKALHIIAVISWMAGLLYLPRLFVYHADAEAGSELSETLKIMERRLYKFIMFPAMKVSWVAGLLMLYANTALLSEGWVHAKLTFVVLLTGAHHAQGAWLKKFATDANEKSDTYYRIANEIPTVLMIAIVILAVVKPF